MTVLVAYASKHGATKGIAEHIAETLKQSGRSAEALPIDAIGSLGGYDAAVIGSALYYGSWMKEAVDFVLRNRATLSNRPVWLFSSGPLGAEVKDGEQQPKELEEIQASIGAREHRIFFGAADHHTLSFPERIVLKAVRAPEGDFRNWDAIAAWAREIASALPAETSASQRPVPTGS
jgi:menaquinone-dependent protoporphyrinogen oxidase